MLCFQSMFFFLLQTEQGDIFKCTLETDEEMVMVTEIRMKYFDTTPIASSMCVLKTGFLFVASEFGNQYVLYKKFLRTTQRVLMVPRPLYGYAQGKPHKMYFISSDVA